MECRSGNNSYLLGASNLVYGETNGLNGRYIGLLEHIMNFVHVYWLSRTNNEFGPCTLAWFGYDFDHTFFLLAYWFFLYLYLKKKQGPKENNITIYICHMSLAIQFWISLMLLIICSFIGCRQKNSFYHQGKKMIRVIISKRLL